MKLLTTKNLAAATLTAAMGMASTSAMAFPLFTIDEASVEGYTVGDVVADRITGGYTERVTFEAVTAATGNFFTSIIFNAGQFFNGAVQQDTLLNSPILDLGYALYATFLGEGTYVTNAVDSTTDFVFTGGTFDLFVDPDRDTIFTIPVDGKTAYGVTPGNPDLKVGSGSIIFGSGTLDPLSPTCGTSGGVNCGSFGTNTDFQLTAFGETYFVDPIPFYNLTFESGQFLNFTVAGTQTISGSMDVVFGTKSVPEPTSVALMGLGLLGLGLRRRKA